MAAELASSLYCTHPTVTGSLPPCNLAHDQTNDLTIATCTDIFRRCESYIGLARRASRCIEPR
ncbi:hypothetical protein QQP08_015898 [Theobroma cacao]|nr:hypothetical protein QQP08_015898 [Theobroma cacao]